MKHSNRARGRRIGAAVTLTTITVLGSLAPTPGAFASSTGASTSVKAAGATSDILCDYIVSRGNTIPLCFTGTYLDGGRPYRWPVTRLGAGFPNRVWFHQNEDGSGWSKCYSGGGHVYSIDSAFQHPGNIFVSDNTAPC